MKIAFLTLGYEAEMYRSLLQTLAAEGHEVTAIFPVAEQATSCRTENGVRVLRFRHLPMLGVGLIRKGIANLLLPYRCKAALKKQLRGERFDLILMTTPPLSFLDPVRLLKSRDKTSLFYLILRDIHPAGAKFIGLDRYKPVYAYFRGLEMKLYALADGIGCMSPGNIRFIEHENPQLDPAKLHLLPNWEPAPAYTAPAPGIRAKYGLEDKYVVLYGGNMGIPQGLDIVLDLAERKKNLTDVLFLFVGKGTEKARLQQCAVQRGLDNVRFMDFVPREDYNDIMKVADVGIISLHPKVPIPNIPSKTLGYFAAKLPVLASIDPVTDYGQYMLEQTGGGLWALATDPDRLSEHFDTLYRDAELRRQMGESGYRYLKQHFTTELAAEAILSFCRQHHANRHL